MDTNKSIYVTERHEDHIWMKINPNNGVKI
jgi:hypothetical protein